jgi:signal transduction histidine kinase/Tfp pilus assembly protein PilF
MSTAQTGELDQLLKKATKSTGRDKIRALAEISKFYSTTDPDKGIEYGKQALQISNSLNIKTEKDKIYNNLGVNYLTTNQLDSTRICFEIALREALQDQDSVEIGIAYTGIGLVYERKGEFDSTLLVFQKALSIFKQIHNDERIGRTLDNIGTIHIHRGEFKTSLTYLLEAKGSYEKSGSATRLPYLFIKIGRVYSETGESLTAEKWYRKGKQLAIERNDFQTAGIAINAIGIMCKNQGKYEEALKNYLEVIPIADKINNKSLLLAVYGNIGNVYQTLGAYKMAIDFHQKAINIASQLDAPVDKATHLVGLGNAYNSMKDFHKSIKYLEEALPVFTTANSRSNLLSTYEALIVANNGLKKYEHSVTYYEKYLDLKDSLNKHELNSALDSLKVKFNTEQTLHENTLLAQKSEIQEKTISLQRNMIGSAITIAVLLIGFLLMIFINRQKIRKANILLEEKNAEISIKAEELKQSNQKLVELSGFKDSLQSFLVHDLKNPLNKLLSINSKESYEENAEDTRQSAKQMLNIVSNLLDINKYENKVMKLAIHDKSLSHLINEAYGQTQYLAQQKSLKLVTGFPNDYMLNIDSEIITRVLVNLLTNAIKFSHIGGQISISAEPHDQSFVKLIVNDEGEGIPVDYQSYVFDKYSQAEVRHLGFAGSTGIGLSFCKIAVESHGGIIGVYSEVGKGSSFWLTLPFNAKLDGLPEGIAVFTDDTTLNINIEFSKEELAYLDPYCNILKSTSIYQISDIKETLKNIDWKSDNIKNWKCHVLKALSACNEVKYFELVNLESNESN